MGTPHMSPRQRRLLRDSESIRGVFAGHPHIRVKPMSGSPPEVYRVTYKVKGLRLEGDQPVPADEHKCEIRLPLGYPREQPYVLPLTPVFHPNVSTHYCIGDYHSAGMPLVDVITKIGDMLQYRIFNVKSPLNAVAAQWAAQNAGLFPIGHVQLGPAEVDIKLRPRDDGANGGGRMDVQL
jgi:ubiquitin-protein ligase